ncbi:MAG: penicillin acylase family protein, partial [Rhodothermales bacterium]
GRIARAEFESLPSESRQVLEAYTRGVNSALAEKRVLMSDELVVLEELPERWEPWHSLAVERLFAWLATSPPHPDSLRRVPLSLRRFFQADNFLRQWLHLHGFENGASWVLADSAGSTFYQRHVYGASALPIYQEVSIEWPGSSLLKGATLIGTPFMPAGLNQTHAWSILLSSSLRLERSQRDSSQVPLFYERIISSDGKEHLLQIESGSRGIYFEPATSLFPVRSDTTSAAVGWVLRWAGLTSGSDIAAWESLISGSQASFELFEGDGLLFSRSGGAVVMGDPLVTTSPGGGIFVSNNPWARYSSERLDSLSDRPGDDMDPGRIRDDQRSMWAERLAPPLIDAAIGVPDQSNPVAEALAYLRNWDHSYDRASIAGSVFDTWMAAYRDSL